MFSKIITALSVLIAGAFAQQTYPNVKVELFYEALCPGCQSFITGPLTSVMSKPDIVDIIDLKMVPYGNTKKNADGSFTCQHGVDECTSDVLEMCTLYKLSHNISSISTGDTHKTAWPYLQCMELNSGNPKMSESCFTKNMASTGLDYAEVTACSSKEALDVQNAGKAATDPTGHTYVPWVLVDNTLLDNTNLLLRSICAAYTGPKPASCPGATADDSKCFKE